MSDEADVAEIERFNKQNLKRVEIQKKNPLPSKETTELERQTDESSRGMHAKMHWKSIPLSHCVDAWKISSVFPGNASLAYS
ncbi:thymosin beta-4-like [Urocitellus parryii]|uniref:thymosin beta-4-like n=1 Tax=Urocitellus parryii TaxID=9999 RepID=UPI000E55AB02|nr:thymosin beta-4-like [Urocitellus parryii]